MNCFGKPACLAVALAGIVGAAAADDDQVQAGLQVFERRCQDCQRGTPPADAGSWRARFPIWPVFSRQECQGAGEPAITVRAVSAT
jgi:hypothetical protein